jgi:amidase
MNLISPNDPSSSNMVLVPAHDHAAAKHTAARDAQLLPELIPAVDIPRNPSKLYRQLLSARETEIVELDATALAQAIAERKYTSVEVTEAYLKSAVGAHAGTNCLAWFDAKLARERAKWLDEKMEKSGPVGPLHGVPMSVKGVSRQRPGDRAALISRLHVRQGVHAELGTSVFRRLHAGEGCGHDGYLPSCRCR